jgi:hypothetical protein
MAADRPVPNRATFAAQEEAQRSSNSAGESVSLTHPREGPSGEKAATLLILTDPDRP